MENTANYKGIDVGCPKQALRSSDILSGQFSEFYKHYRQDWILKEFEYIAKHPIPGIYVFPSLKSLQIWHGVVFVNAGLYADGIFHFKIILNDDYPFSKPTIRFTSNVFHPRITMKGNLDIVCALPNHKIGKIWKVLEYIMECFKDIHLQSACSGEIKESTDFKALIRGCVLESLYEFEEQEMESSSSDLETDNPFNATLLSRKTYMLIREGLLDQTETRDGEEGLFNWTKNAIGKVWNNISQFAPESLNVSGESRGETESPKKLLLNNQSKISKTSPATRSPKSSSVRFSASYLMNGHSHF